MVIKLTEIINQNLINNVINCNNIPGDDTGNIQTLLKKYTGKVVYSQIFNFGRYYAKDGLSLQNFQKDIRKYLSNGNYIDLDIVNCHPVILEQLFVRYSIQVPKFLIEYNNDRNETITRYKLKDKLTFLIIINTSDSSKIYNKDILECHNAIYQKLLPKLLQDYIIPGKEPEFNINGSKFAKIMQHIENDILMIMFKKCKELKVKVGVLVFDGMMVEKETCRDINLSELNEKLECEVKQKLNFNIKLEEKSMKTEWKPIFTEKLNKNLESDKLKEECQELIKENFDHSLYEYKVNNCNISSQLNNTLIKKLICECKDSDHIINITKNGYCSSCEKCLMTFPRNGFITIPDKYTNLTNYFNITINQTINNYNGDSPFNIDFNSKIEESILNDQNMTCIVNNCLGGFMNKLSELLFYIYKDHIWTGETWYYFNGSKWCDDSKGTQLKRVIMRDLCDGLFKDKILAFYNNKTDKYSTDIIKALIILIKKLNEPKFKDDIIKEGYQFFENLEFFKNLNMKKNILPFNNGIFDLKNMQFRNGERSDYIELTCDFDYNNKVCNKEVYTFIEQILPKKEIRDYVLKKFSDCLNGDIPNTNFLMFIGSEGANGKSQLLNLMKLTMGEFGEKVEVSLLTRKRSDANQANTEKIKLCNKRYAFLSEPEDGEKINIGLLKELTGSEEIIARGLYEKSKTFIMETKLFLACNELPEIKGEDQALWRRIKVVEFSSKFVDEPDPENKNEFKIDRNLFTKMREDPTWRQTFMNILIEYYNKQIKEPEEVSKYTNKYRENNDKNLEFANTYIKKEESGFILWSELWQIYQDWYFELHGNTNNLKKLQTKKYFIEKIFKIEDKMVKNKGRGWINYNLIKLN